MTGKIQVTVAEPCHENWNMMTVVEQGRFCQSCQKTVTDFSMMNDKEILNHLSQRNTNVCGRFTNDQLNRPLVTDHRKKFSWAYIWNLMIATFLTTGYASAHSKQMAQKKAPIIKKHISETTKNVVGEELIPVYVQGDTIRWKVATVPFLNGIIHDSKTNLPIPYASIIIKGALKGGAADSRGMFYLPVSTGQKEVVISVSAIGYEPKEFTITPTANKLSFYLDPSEKILEPVIIIGYPPISCRSVAGGVSVVADVGMFEKMKRSLKDWTPELLKKKEVKLYPNPVSPGATITIALSLKETGSYTTEILDASGRIVYRSKISIQSKEQNITIPTSAAWNKGMYWLRLTGNNSKKLYHSKLILQ